MAAGKQDSRQKMINMMYLVFIAMLALNISKEVLATLGILNDEIENSIRSKSEKSEELYGLFKQNAENPSYSFTKEYNLRTHSQCRIGVLSFDLFKFRRGFFRAFIEYGVKRVIIQDLNRLLDLFFDDIGR